MTELRARRPKGTGRVYTRPDSDYYWIHYSFRGRLHREKTHLLIAEKGNERAAEKLLRTRQAEIQLGTFWPSDHRVKVHELYEEVERDYRRSGRKSLDKIEERWRLHLRPFFGIIAATHLTTPVILRYIDARQAEGAKNASINRELAILKRAYNMARQQHPPKVQFVPHIPKLKENNVRTGFLEIAQHDALASACRELGGLWMEAIFEVGYTFGWRRREVTRLRVKQVLVTSSTMGYIRLDVGTTKNEEGREVPIQGRLLVLLRECIRGKRPDDCVFTREGGEPVRDFRKTWWNACCAVGLGQFVCPECEQAVEGNRCPDCSSKWEPKELKYVGLIFHDLRRTGARNLRRAGVSEKVIMRIGGWKTDHVFRRYDIVDNRDLADAMAKLAEHQARTTEDFAQLGRDEDVQSNENNSGSVRPDLSRIFHEGRKLRPPTPPVRRTRASA